MCCSSVITQHPGVVKLSCYISFHHILLDSMLSSVHSGKTLFKRVVNILLYYMATACAILTPYKPQDFSKTVYGAANRHAVGILHFT